MKRVVERNGEKLEHGVGEEQWSPLLGAAGAAEPETAGAANREVAERLRRVESGNRAFVLFAVVALLVALAALLGVAFDRDSGGGGGGGGGPVSSSVEPPQPIGDYIANYAPGTKAGDPAAKGVRFEPYRRPDPTLPAVPAGAVKKFRMDVYEHVTKVARDLAPTRVWSYGVNGKLYRGTGVSAPMVVNQGDRVEIELVNGGSDKMDVRFPHSIDHHASEVNPAEAFKTVNPGERHTFRFVAKHPGVFMYHCATQPVLMHTGAGMVGMLVVKPRDLAPVDRELWITQQEFYIGKPGADADMGKMEARNPSVVAFNGYAAQYKDQPIGVRRGERIRMYVMNAGPSIWSAFHVIGTVFDRTYLEGTTGHDAQTINVAPSQGGWVEFTLDKEGAYPFVTHDFGHMVRGAVGVLATEKAGTASKH